MKRNHLRLLFLLILMLSLSACQAVPPQTVHYDPASLRFDGELARATVEKFVTMFPDRDSGQPNNRAAAEWLLAEYSSYGLECSMDELEVINFSQPLPLQNVVCSLPGEHEGEILIVAHHDQSPDTVYGADNDGSGIAILLQLAQIFASEGIPHYTLTFISTDGEEWGMLGTKRYIETHPDVSQIIAGVSLDNLGKHFYYNLEMSPIGQFRGYGPLWLQRTVQEAARAADGLWVPPIRIPLDQILNQAVPVSFMDQGPMVAAGVPALGFAGLVPAENTEDHWNSYHAPGDVVELQSTEVLAQSGGVTEALLRELLGREEFPRESGPYLYFAESDQVLRGAPLYAIFTVFTVLFFIGAALRGGKLNAEKVQAWRKALPHLLSTWLPLFGGLLLVYGMVAVGLMERFDTYPATAKHDAIFHPRWPAVFVFLLGVGLLFWWLRKTLPADVGTGHGERHSLGLLVIGLGALWLLLVNPFSLLFLVPTLAWFGLRGRRGWGFWLDLLLFLLGFLIVYALVYFFGFVILRNGLNVLWYLLMMFSSRTIGFPAALVITAIVGAGLSMIVRPRQPLKE